MLFVLGIQKYNQNNSVTLLNFSDLTQLSGFFGQDLGFKLVFGFGLIFSGSGLYFRVRACTSRPVYNSRLLTFALRCFASTVNASLAFILNYLSSLMSATCNRRYLLVICNISGSFERIGLFWKLLWFFFDENRTYRCCQ